MSETIQNISKPLTQAERLAEELMQIKPDVTAADRAEATKEHGYSRGTISIYLNGNVYDNDTAVTMLSFFRKRIAAREKKIAQ